MTKCKYMEAAYPLLGDEACSEHQHDVSTFELAKALAVVCQSPNPSDEQIAWFLDDAGAVVSDFDPTPTEWEITGLTHSYVVGLDFVLRINDKPYVIPQSDWEPSHPISLAEWQSWHRSEEDFD